MTQTDSYANIDTSKIAYAQVKGLPHGHFLTSTPLLLLIFVQLVVQHGPRLHANLMSYLSSLQKRLYSIKRS